MYADKSKHPIFKIHLPDVNKFQREYDNYLYYHNNHPTIHCNRFDILTKEDFIKRMKGDESFKKRWSI